jgi:hypothetical protein
MEITIMASLLAKWNMDVNARQFVSLFETERMLID